MSAGRLITSFGNNLASRESKLVYYIMQLDYWEHNLIPGLIDGRYHANYLFLILTNNVILYLLRLKTNNWHSECFPAPCTTTVNSN